MDTSTQREQLLADPVSHERMTVPTPLRTCAFNCRMSAIRLADVLDRAWATAEGIDRAEDELLQLVQFAGELGDAMAAYRAALP